MSTAENPFAGQGSVMLDIGGDVGALVVTMPAALVDTEVEIRPVGVVTDHSHGGHHHDSSPGHSHDSSPGHSHGEGHGHDHGAHLAHVAVVERPVVGGTVPSLVFAELTTGRYELFEKGCPQAVALSVEVEGGRVTTAEWPG
jgi:hypothetical protein